MTDTRLALCDVRGPLNDLTEKLCGEEGSLWLSGFNKFLRKENPWEQGVAVAPFAIATYPKSDPVVIELVGVVLPEQSRTLGDRIADGAYDWFNNDITEKRFPLTLSAGPRELATVWFKRNVKIEYVEQWAAANGYEVALIDDLLAVGSHSEYKELQLQFPIIALGSSSVVGGHVLVPYLCWDGSRRLLFLNYRGIEWRDDCRFLLRKVSGNSAP